MSARDAAAVAALELNPDLVLRLLQRAEACGCVPGRHAGREHARVHAKRRELEERRVREREASTLRKRARVGKGQVVIIGAEEVSAAAAARARCSSCCSGACVRARGAAKKSLSDSLERSEIWTRLWSESLLRPRSPARRAPVTITYILLRRGAGSFERSSCPKDGGVPSLCRARAARRRRRRC